MLYMSAIEGRTDKTAVLPEFCKIEPVGGSGNIIRVLYGFSPCAMQVAPLYYIS